MSFHEPYFDIDAISNSTLGNIDVSIAYWKWQKENPSEPSVATLLGSGLHECILEPEKFKLREESEYKTVCPSYFKKDYEKGSERLLAGQIEQILQMRKALEDHPEGKDIFTEAETEIAVEFDYQNIKCKSKIDWINHDRKLIRDLKSIDKIENAEKVIYNYNYFRQAAFYQLACFSKYGTFYDFEFVFVSKEEIPEVKVVVMHEDWFALGIREVDRIFKKYKDYLSGYETFEGAFKEKVTSYPVEWQLKKLLGAEYDNVG